MSEGLSELDDACRSADGPIGLDLGVTVRARDQTAAAESAGSFVSRSKAQRLKGASPIRLRVKFLLVDWCGLIFSTGIRFACPML